MLRSTLTFVALCGVSSCFQGCHSTDGLTPPDPKTPWVPPPSVGLGFEPPVLPSLDDFGPMGVGDCLAQALEHQPQTRRFWNQALAQAAYHQEQKATLLPTGGLTAGVEQQDMQFKSTANLSKSKVDQTLKGAGVNLQWVLFSFGARTALIEGALHGLYGANFRYNQALQDMALNVQMSYYELQSAKAQLVASKARRSEAESTLDAVQTKFLTGLADQQERFRAQAEYASANYTLQAAYGLVENARAQLAQAMGVKVHQIEEWLQDAMANRPVLKQAYQDWQRLESESKAAKSAILPQVVATAGASRYSGIENGLRPDRETAIGIGIQWQIFDFFQDQAKALQMRHQADAAKAAYESQQSKYGNLFTATKPRMPRCKLQMSSYYQRKWLSRPHKKAT
jgi:outer membrane protein